MVKWFNVGKIVNTHGLQGEIKVVSNTDFPDERYAVGNTLYLFLNDQPPMPLTVRTHRVHKNFHLLTFDNYLNINLVEGFKNGLLKVSEDQLSSLEQNEYYFHEIIGCSVFTTSGDEIGVVKEILTPGANDVWVVKGEKGKEHYIPYIEDVVLSVSVKEKQITIEPMEGLLS